MRLVIATDRWGASLGGRERYLADLAEATRRAGHEVEVLTCAAAARLPAGSGPVLATEPCPGATHWQLHSGLMRTSLAAERESFDGLRRALSGPASLLNLRRRRLLRREERALRSPARPRLMVFSRSLASEIADRYGTPAGDITVLPPAVDLDRLGAREPRARRRAPLRLLFVAHNFRLKGLAPLLSALGQATRRGLDASLTVAGRGPVRVFRTLARREGLAERAHFAGDVPSDGMGALYRAHDALVHPTFHDPCSLVVLEAMALGLPVVTTRRNGAAEYFESGRQGFLVDDPRDTDALADAVGALADPRRLEEMGREAALLGPRFAFPAHAARVLEWLR